MAYQRLPYPQYFIDNSEDFNHTGKARGVVEYKAVPYHCHAWEELLGIHHAVDYDIHYEADRNVIQINFQKTNGRSDWFANIFEFSSRYYDSIQFEGSRLQLRVHHGWGNMYRSIKYTIRDTWSALKGAHPDAATEIIGWSLGSGQAILCAQDLNYNFGEKPYLYTFGSVRPFRYTRKNREVFLRYLASLCADCRNFAVNNDIVTYMPPFYGFTMVNRVDLAEDERSLKRLLDPNYYHTIYDHEALYREQD